MCVQEFLLFLKLGGGVTPLKNTCQKGVGVASNLDYLSIKTNVKQKDSSMFINIQ